MAARGAGNHSPSRVPVLPLIRSISPLHQVRTPSPLFPSPQASVRRISPFSRASIQTPCSTRSPTQLTFLPTVSSPPRLPPTPKFPVSHNLRSRFLHKKPSPRPQNTPSPVHPKSIERRTTAIQLESALQHIKLQVPKARGNVTERNKPTETLVPEPWPMFNAFDSFSKS